MSEVAEKTAEIVAENVEEAVDGVVDVVEVVRNNPIALIAAGVVGAAVGAAGAYFIAKQQLKAYYEDLATQEIAQAREFYSGVYKTDVDGTVMSPQEVLAERHGAKAAADALLSYQGKTAAQSVLEDETDEEDEALLAKTESKVGVVEAEDGTIMTTEVQETRNVFVDPTFDYEEELKYRTEDKPYIITHDEFFGAEKDYETQSLTYYEEDDTLTNERDEPIREIDKMVGEDHLVRFGTASKDKNIVYVRNDRLELDFEIIKSTGSYVEEVLGMLDNDESSLKHSDQRYMRRAFRHGDE